MSEIILDKESEGIKFLKNIRRITRLIEDLQEEIDKAYTILTSTTVKPKEVDVQTSTPSDPMADKIIIVQEYKQQLEEYQADLFNRKTLAIDIIKNMDIDSQQLLTLRYLKGKTIDETMVEVGRSSYYHTWEAIHKAEEEFCKIFAKRV